MNSSITNVRTTTGWVGEALAWKPEMRQTVVNGARIAYRAWGTATGRDILFVHGGGAHSGWWDHIAPLFATGGRVVALDLSGHGDSDYREGYSLEQWGAEVLAVQKHAGLAANTVFIGHSLGGLVTLSLRGMPNSEVHEAIVIDSPIGGPNAERLPEAAEIGSRRRSYPTLQAAMARFRAVPTQPFIHEVRDHIARDSIHEVGDGWTWKFDAAIFGGAAKMTTTLPGQGGQLGYFRAENGIVGPEVRGSIERAGGIFLDLPGAGHAPMLDQPAALVTGIRAVMAGWERPSPATQ